ncbi:DUF6083 domain-containing protein [Streptomyces sp. NPDC057362]|uniref:DUF6083 domain-containing protein n=1 Tax=Streptomyces sp. NPDC057362 TaxID=3346106 RepID=UPI0036364193
MCDLSCLRSHMLGRSRDPRQPLRGLRRAVCHGPRMRSQPICPHHHGDGSARLPHTRPPLWVSVASPRQPQGARQTRRCNACGNRIEHHPPADRQLVVLYPAEPAADTFPEDCRWHSRGVAHPHGDGMAVPGAATTPPRQPISPHRAATPQDEPRLDSLRLGHTPQTHHLIDISLFAPRPRSAQPVRLCPPGRPHPDEPPLGQHLGRRLLQRSNFGMDATAYPGDLVQTQAAWMPPTMRAGIEGLPPDGAQALAGTPATIAR